jgi:cytochrome c biogenesis protein CcmG/thiol:disulfide interchange protein DsbE
MKTDDIAPHQPHSEPAILKRNHSRKRNIAFFIAVSILNAALLILLWTQLLTPAQSPIHPTYNHNSTISSTINSPLVGKPAPDFTLETLTSTKASSRKLLHLATFKGTPVVLNFWASWCDPCNQEAPSLQKSWLRLQPKGIMLIGIDGPEKSGDAQKFLQKYGITYPNVQDTIEGTTAIHYGVMAFPQTVFIDKRGFVVAKSISPLTEQELQFEMAKLTH